MYTHITTHLDGLLVKLNDLHI